MFLPKAKNSGANLSEVGAFLRTSRKPTEGQIFKTKEVLGIGGSRDKEFIVIRYPSHVIGLRP